MAGEESITLPTNLLIKYHSDYFIETGSFYGGAIQAAIDAGFSDIRSVEVDTELFLHCQERFKYDLRVALYHGDSLKELPKMMADIDERITFWLDAHAGNSSTEGEVSLPILHELEIIGKHHRKDHIIMIDDVRLFGNTSWIDVTKLKVLNAVLKINPDYTIVFEDSKAFKEDILVAFMLEGTND